MNKQNLNFWLDGSKELFLVPGYSPWGGGVVEVLVVVAHVIILSALVLLVLTLGL